MLMTEETSERIRWQFHSLYKSSTQTVQPEISSPSVLRFPFIYSKTEELVWRWDQLRLCGQSIDIALETVEILDDQPINWSDRDHRYISGEGSTLKVLPPAHLTNLDWDGYKIGIFQSPMSVRRKIILLGYRSHSPIFKFPRFLRPHGRTRWRKFQQCRVGWSTELWISDCVVIDRMSPEKQELVISALRSKECSTRVFVCIGLPVTTFGPLFNTIVSTQNGGTDSFELSNGFIWVEALLDVKTFSMKSDTLQDPIHHPFLYMQKQMGGKSLLVEAKLTFELATSTRMKTAIQAELLEVSNIRTTSSHKPITHAEPESLVV
ncbi:uncharacterized protein N7473_004479 [Penicillium subrubescens]|uniref:uncharacterized protein n=1 Tax=Penicillium subrubescens TaxID=1316194 RepID=UPI0025451DE7|nr:uncharacterized protein N7473_004479 [Penicillium subrubescens]KAJ5900409.1 hypothetical protein N7473_004479 [Penicillium subrubescens]